MGNPIFAKALPEGENKYFQDLADNDSVDPLSFKPENTQLVDTVVPQSGMDCLQLKYGDK